MVNTIILICEREAFKNDLQSEIFTINFLYFKQFYNYIVMNNLLFQLSWNTDIDCK